MILFLVRTTSHSSVYHDQANDWLFAGWQGEVDLPAAQRACLELAHVCLQRPCRRALSTTGLFNLHFHQEGAPLIGIVVAVLAALTSALAT